MPLVYWCICALLSWRCAFAHLRLCASVHLCISITFVHLCIELLATTARSRNMPKSRRRQSFPRSDAQEVEDRPYRRCHRLPCAVAGRVATWTPGQSVRQLVCGVCLFVLRCKSISLHSHPPSSNTNTTMLWQSQATQIHPSLACQPRKREFYRAQFVRQSRTNTSHPSIGITALVALPDTIWPTPCPLCAFQKQQCHNLTHTHSGLFVCAPLLPVSI